MHKFYLLLVMFAVLILVFPSIVLAYQDHLWVYRDPGYTKEAMAFDDGDTVYVKVTDWITQSTPASVSVTNNIISNSIEVPVSDSIDPTIYKGQFIVHSGLQKNDKLRIFNGQTATIAADLDNDGKSATAQIVALYIPPAPTNLQAIPIAGGKVKLKWNASNPEDTVKQYNIYRGTISGGEDYTTPIATVSAESASYKYTDSGLTSEQTYYYTVKAEDKTGDESDASNEASATAEEKLLVCEFKSKVAKSDSPLDIILSVSKDSDISIRIFNLNGEIVKEDSISISPGVDIEWIWQGENMYNQKVNNGVYILVIKAVAADGERQTEKKTVGVLF